MSTQATSALSYLTSAILFVKGLFVSAADAFASMPTEGKIGALLGVGTFLINWYYKRKSLDVLTRHAPQREPDDAD
jgi:hypothetical protein